MLKEDWEENTGLYEITQTIHGNTHFSMVNVVISYYSLFERPFV